MGPEPAEVGDWEVALRAGANALAVEAQHPGALSSSPSISLRGLFALFTDEETEAQRGEGFARVTQLDSGNSCQLWDPYSRVLTLTDPSPAEGRGSLDQEEGDHERRQACGEESTLSSILPEWLRVGALGAECLGSNPSLDTHCL